MKKQIVFSLLVALGTQQVAQAAFFVPLAQAGKDTASLASDYVQPLVAAAVVIGLATPVSELDMLKVEISAIIERLSSSIKLAGDSYTSETYSLLEKKFDLANWRASVDSKLEIIKDMHTLYQHRIDVIREDSLTILIIVLIMIELIVAIIK